MKTTAISVLGTQKDAHGGTSPARWNTWRPTIGLVQQEALRIDELHLILNEEYRHLAEQVGADIATVSPETKVVIDIVQLKDPWDFEEVYEKFYDYAKKPCFHEEGTDYYIHITTGSHVEQICLFLLAESHHLQAKLVQTSPKEGHIIFKAAVPVVVSQLVKKAVGKLFFTVIGKGGVAVAACQNVVVTVFH